MSRWTHRICMRCWRERAGDRIPHKFMRMMPGVCCVCGQPDSGAEGEIYFRADPESLLCKGQGSEHEDSEP